jgi:nicotinic acid mononucleotide adenylyltransferase
VAHGELIRAAASHVDEVLCVLPREFPHKEYHGASLEQRIGMLAASFPSCSIGVSDGGLFIEIARECREHYDDGTRLYFICGRDAAERIVTWDYGRPGAIQEILGEFELLVAPRGGHYEPPPELRHRIRSLAIPPGHEEVSSTEVRERIRRHERWEHLVPEEIVDHVRKIYS